MSSSIVTVEQILSRLRNLTQQNAQAHWHYHEGDLPVALATTADTWNTWGTVELNQKEHIAWAAGKQVLWLGQKLVIPAHLHHYPLTGLTLRLALTWWADQAQVYVNGELVQEGDLFDCFPRICLRSAVTPGETLALAIRLVSPGHDQGALVRSQLIYESSQGIDPGFVADELAVVQTYLAMESQKTGDGQSLAKLADMMAEIDWQALPDREQFEASLQTVRDALQIYSPWLKQRRISLTGHAHLDLAWLWPVAETWEVAERTFASVLALQTDFPELIFCHSTPALYAWIEQHRPELFAAIQNQIASDRWEVVAGLWVEPDLNLISGESLVRQVLYGQRYVQEKFGRLSKIAWLPDTFGFCWQLPQILCQGGVDYFVTQKLRWNDTTRFPHDLFWWRSPDGSQILSLMSAPIGEGVDPIKLGNYACEWERSTGYQHSLWLPGVGDHGGGPTRDMLEMVRRWQQSPLVPDLEFTPIHTYLQSLETELISPALPTWNDELYLEFHRGCYTTHADQKRANRHSEILLYQAELFAALATLITNTAYPQVALETAWKQTLFNQFHDILPGSSIPQVFTDANREWAAVQSTGEQILTTALAAIAAEIALPIPPDPESLPLVVFNSLNGTRSQVVNLALPTSLRNQSWQVFDLAGKGLATDQGGSLQFYAGDVPGVGYRLFWLCPARTEHTLEIQRAPEFVLENQHLRAEINPATGELSSLFDKTNQRQVLSGPGNQLQFFQDSGQYWDAWNIDPDYADHPLPGLRLETIHWQTYNAVEQRIRVNYQFGASHFQQDYVLETQSPVLKITTTVDWQSRQMLVKAAFPLTVTANFATYEVACAAIQRPTLPNPLPLNPHQLTQWEVPALQWADLSDAHGEYGVSLLNDCKYGYDASPNQLRLTLLRSPNWPDPDSDRGLHQFTYALYPHAGDWVTARTPQQAAALNQPLQVVITPSLGGNREAKLAPLGQLLHLGSEDLVLMAFKQAENEPDSWILRCYEGYGHSAELKLNSDLALTFRERVDLLERLLSEEPQPDLTLQPWQIGSFKLDSQLL